METIVFTNGCFDIIHPGHIDLLERARALGTKLIVGINSDKSVQAIKGLNHPFINENGRALILKSLRTVDEVRIFDELTPEKLIEDIKPDVLVKGGDWVLGEIIGADYVLKNGGKVFSLPFKENYSSSKIVEKVRSKISNINIEKDIEKQLVETVEILFANSLNAHLEVVGNVLQKQIPQIIDCAESIYKTLTKGGKILICGNGGSAADAQHIAAEFVGRFETERAALPAIALTTDTSALTALGNDYGFERIYARQTEALARPGDVLIALSTSGNSPNIISAVMSARKIGCGVIGLTGAKGKKLASLCDGCILVPSERTSRIQETHITIAHLWCEFIDWKIKSKK
jgi:D-sedoheptulose 7-phosphate isomerase